MKKYLFKITILPVLFVWSTIGAKAQTTNQPVVPDANSAINSPKVDSTKFVRIDQVPEFPGGIGKLFEYLKKNFKTPRNNGIDGSIKVSFVVERDGSVIEVKIVKGLSIDLDKEAVRVVSQSPKWHPGMQNGKPVRVAYSIPIRVPFD